VKNQRALVLSFSRVFAVCGSFALALFSSCTILSAQQRVTYPLPSQSAARVPTSGSSTTNITGCNDPANNGSSTTPFNTFENVFPPLFWVNGFPTNGVFPGSSLIFPSSVTNVLTLVNGVSLGQGSASKTDITGTYPAVLGSGRGTDGTYTATVSGSVVTEHWKVNAQIIYAGQGLTYANDTYTFDSVYNIQSGVQTYSINFQGNGIETQIPTAPGCVEAGAFTEAGTVSYSYYSKSSSPLSITTTALPNGTVGMAYPSTALAATGGTPPYTWSASGLPAGLTVDSTTGIISGTPIQGDQASVDVQVKDSLGSTASTTLPLTVVGCQAKVPPPPIEGSNWYQLDSNWAGDPYDHIPGETIGVGGCCLTALNVALNAAGESFNPGSLNSLMNGFPGDYSPHDPAGKDPRNGGLVQWTTATPDVSGGTLYFDRSQANSTSTTALDYYLCSATPKPVIVQVNGKGHCVVVTGKTGSGYSIIDPGHIVGHTSLADYSNNFTVVGAVKSVSGDPSELDFVVVDYANMLVTAPDGSRTGFDPISGQVVQALPNSAYFVQDNSVDTDAETLPATSTTYSVGSLLPKDGTYTVQLTGLQAGSYQLGIKSFDVNGKAQTYILTPGIANVGSSSTFRVQYVSTPGATSTVTRLATFDSTLADIANSLALDLIDNAGIANALSSKIQAASSAASSGQNQAAGNILHAFVNQLSAQTGKHVTGVAPQILSEDADSLISQLP
jgi:hypothetical protein